MSNHPFIDADSHVEEHIDVFKYLDKQYEWRRPYIADVPGLVSWNEDRDKLWIIDGEIRPKLFGRNPSCYGTPNNTRFAAKKPVSPEIQGLQDVDAYVDSMRSIGLDKAVIYSTLFLHPVTTDIHFEASLMRAWNRWMSEKVSLKSDALHYGALVPIKDPHLAAQEVRWAAKNGATSIMIPATAGNTLLSDRRYDEFYEALSETGLPLCVHVGWANQAVNDHADSIAASLILNFEMGMMFGLYAFLAGGVLDRFPKLKVAFLEAGAVWLPTFLDRANKWYKTPTAQPWPAQKAPLDYLGPDHNVYFTVEGDEDGLGDFVKLVGEDRVLGSADFPHVHYEGGKLGSTFEDLKRHPDLTPEQRDLILGSNSMNFYAFGAS